MTTEYVWNGLRVRRNGRGFWQFKVDGHDWFRLSDRHHVESAVIAELDKLYPLPRTVTLDGQLWERRPGVTSPEWTRKGTIPFSAVADEAKMLDRIWELENGDDR